MAERIKVSCINKSNRTSPYERIQFIGGIHNNSRWKLSVADAISGIEQSKYEFYTQVNGHVRQIKVTTRLGVKYLKTEADSDTPDNLLSLPECRELRPGCTRP
ncbi:DUF3892 domain-containing protein [Pedobacter sp. JY14-1]|uniref:DUF3892 domain-containing protein n=1 Tax=Pedobacter sp. JY14-1 TaxID=3034151 RepID=UPI0023E12078|nr:DUF3892 domain-containing protein [Pedobacter sp. JY14-1]